MARASIDATLDTDRLARALDVVSKHSAACAAELRKLYPEGPPPIADLDEAVNARDAAVVVHRHDQLDVHSHSAADYGNHLPMADEEVIKTFGPGDLTRLDGSQQAMSTAGPHAAAAFLEREDHPTTRQQ